MPELTPKTPPPSGAIAIIGIVNAAHPDLPLVGGGQMGIRLADPSEPNLVVNLNGVAARGVKPGFDAGGFAVLLVDLNASQPGPLAAGPLAVQVIRTRPDGTGVLAQSDIVKTSIIPAFAAPPVIDVENGQLVASMTLLVAPEAWATALLSPRGGPSQASRSISCAPRTASSTKLVAPLAGVPAGHYLVRVAIDGLATLLEFSGNAYTGPVVYVPAAG
jgi:hypothetical protein